ncbi:MAG: polyisoprenyl-teichoic acid--peptidoglycan teichoic acid transferase [Thermoleophilaceae bacterium]|jgi:LCP family protein required for cell wall assembly|nr:polyisoprenyl-teichoic acid--peptidoglycan teichoic acid transferase [Thermoleophilaceae bacterium]
MIGAFVIVVAAASATTVAAFNEVNQVVGALCNGGCLNLQRDTLATADAGKPQTILVLGSDKRAKTARDAGGGARSDTMILVRLDPSKKAIAMLSLPRDLKVHIPGHGTQKLNAAYEEGGTELTTKTIKEFTGLSINHVVNVDFRGFREAVDSIGCVYADIDRRYFNNNMNSGDQYATINIQPGYQKLCGQNALDFVRFRHLDNDIVRAARQQDFLRQAKQQVGVGKIVADRRKLTRAFGRYTKSDIRSKAAVLRLLKLVVASANHPIREVHFQGQIGASYVTASSASVRKLTRDFLGVKDTSGPRGSTSRGKRPRGVVVDTSGAGRDQAQQLANQGLHGLPIFYPRRGTPTSRFVGPPRMYKICTSRHKCFKSYRIVVSRQLIGEYYGLQGTAWKDAPILRSPSETKKVKGRQYELHYDGDRLRLVAWRTKSGVYWVSNTLLQTLSTRQMMAIATTARAL